MNQDNLIEKCYDYITAVTTKQGKLLDVKLLFGDGTRFENNFTVFESTYNQIKTFLNGK